MGILFTQVGTTGCVFAYNRAAMPKPPFRKGVDPLFAVGLLEKATDQLFRFFWEHERLYLENQALRAALKKAGGSPDTLQVPSPGSPGPHRKVFDKQYREIAADVRRRLSFLSAKHADSKYGPN
jgi:hypothetical protein